MNPLLFATNFFPFSPGLTIALPGIKAKFADFFSLPSIVGASLGVFYSGAKQINSMMDSGLFPSFNLRYLKKLAKIDVSGGSDVGYEIEGNIVGENKSSISYDCSASERGFAVSHPLKSVLETIIPVTISGVVSYILLVVCYYTIDDLLPYIVHMAGLLACFEICCMMGAYLIFSTRFANMDRGFRSPFGMVGALMAIGLWILLFVTNLYYQDANDRMWVGLSLLFFYVVCMVYYVSFARHRQFFSREEKEKFLKAYIVNANKARRKGRGLFSFGGIFGGKRPFTTLNLHSMQLLGVSRSLLFVSSSVHSVEERDGLQVDLRLSRRPTTNRNPAKLPCPNEVPHEIVCEALS
eukprot:scaffold1867_cov177-Ochromonas_danica.AAC.1